MRKNPIILFMLWATILSFVITGCGAGKTDAPGAAPQSVTGVAATGAPIVGVVTLQASSEPAQARTATTAVNGSFSLAVSGLNPPFILTVEWTDGTGHHKMYSFAEQPGTTNINPFSNAVFAAAAGISDQVSLAGNLDPALLRTVASRHRAAMENLRTALAPLFAQYQTTSNPVSDRFEADHTGLDALFDDVKIFVNNGMIIVRNKRTSQVIFQGPIDNIASGTFYNENIPVVAVTGPGSGQIDGAALYTNKCGSCHGALATSRKIGRTAAQIQAAISANAGGMGSLSTMDAAELQAIAAALGSTTPTSTPTSTPTQGAIDGAALYTQYCNGCHGSGKKGSSATSIQNAINSNRGGMGSLSGLTSEQIQAIATGSTVPAPTTTATPATGTIDGAALYTQYCAGCHGSLATSGHSGATASQIQTGINTISGMMPLSTLTSAQIDAIAAALVSATPTQTPTPAPTVCGSCHTIPPSSGHHSTHRSRSCATCHGTGYSATTVNAATHNNGVKNIASGSTPGWNPTTRSCSNSCHGTERW